MLLMVGAHITYTLSGGTYVHENTGDATCGVRVNTDATIDKLEGAVYTQVDTATDWAIPNDTAAATDHWVRFERISGDTSGFTGTLSTWLKVTGGSSSNRQISYSNSSGILVGIYSIEIATDSGGTNIVAGPVNYSITANAGI